MGFGLVRYSARASITLNQLAGSGCDLNQRVAGERERIREMEINGGGGEGKGGEELDIGRAECQSIKGE